MKRASKRLRVFLIVAVLAGFAACAQTGSPSVRSHVLRIVSPQDFVTLNPHLYAATSLSMVSELTMAYFVRYDHRGRPYPELLTEIPSQDNGGISADGRTITWHLRQGVRWSDGVGFNAGGHFSQT